MSFMENPIKAAALIPLPKYAKGSSLPAGMYILKLQENKASDSLKFTKQ